MSMRRSIACVTRFLYSSTKTSKTSTFEETPEVWGSLTTPYPFKVPHAPKKPPKVVKSEVLDGFGVVLTQF